MAVTSSPSPVLCRALWLCCMWWLTCIVAVYSVQNEITPSCSPSDPICRIQFTISQIETMVLYQNGRGLPIIYQDGVFKKRLNCFQEEDATPEELEQVNMADGRYKFVYGVNKEVPAPTIVVYENQTLEVTVTNLMLHEGVGIHWHGIFQRGSPFMDGVPGVTQCAIHPMETFVYRFKPEPHGTHFYHSHMGVQRTDGVYGGLIVLPETTEDSFPEFAKEFLMLFHDWLPHTNIQDLYKNQYGLSDYAMYGYNATLCERNEPSTIINGRGYQYEGGEPVIPVPLTTYTVQQGQYYRFRLINSALSSAYKVHIDKHKLFVIASDGGYVTPVETDYVVVHTGERYDVYMEANQTVDNYWVRVEFVDYPDQPGLAILRYEGADEVLPTSTHTVCTEEDPCEVVNCPFESFSDLTLYFSCTDIGDLTSSGNPNYFPVPHHHHGNSGKDLFQDLEEHFMVFQSTEDVNDNFKQSINGIHYVPPSKPPQIHREVDFDLDCSGFDCLNAPCHCTHLDTVTLGNTAQIVVVSADGQHGHPVHLHGHRFLVMLVVHGQGFGIHPDITCDNADRCTTPSWTDPSWVGGNIPGLNEEDPPEKDTVIVPRGGYVVLRYLASNPGWWLLHCHMDFHFASGMGVIIQEGTEADMPLVPEGMPTCGSFRYESELNPHVLNARMDDEQPMDGPYPYRPPQDVLHDCRSTPSVIGYVLCFIGGFVMATTILFLAMACTKSSMAKDLKLQSQPGKY